MAEQIKKFFGRGRLLPIAAAATGVGAGMIYLKNRGKSSVVVDESQSNVPESKLPASRNQDLELPPQANPKIFLNPEGIPKPVDDENQTEDLNSKMPSYMDSWTNPEITKPAKEIFENPEDPKKD